MSKVQRKETGEVQELSWDAIKKEELSDRLSRQVVFGEKGTLARFYGRTGAAAARHSHANEEYALVISGLLKFVFDDREVVARAGDIVVIPAHRPHSMVALEDCELIEFFTPLREDWLRGEDQYLRQ